MRDRLFTCFASLVLSLLLVPGSIRAADDTESLEGKAAPDFTLKTLDGKEVKLSDMKGSVVVLDFWATWCPPCRRSLPHLNKVAGDQALADKGLKVLAINCRETSDKVKEFLEKNKYTFNVPLDDGSTMTQYDVQGIPTTVVVGRDGNVRKVFVGFGGEESEKGLDSAIQQAVAEKQQ